LGNKRVTLEDLILDNNDSNVTDNIDDIESDIIDRSFSEELEFSENLTRPSDCLSSPAARAASGSGVRLNATGFPAKGGKGLSLVLEKETIEKKKAQRVKVAEATTPKPKPVRGARGKFVKKI
jgi:hypothetical protein